MSLDKKFADARRSDDELKAVAREFIRLAVEHFEDKSEEPGSTRDIARQASDEYDRESARHKLAFERGGTDRYDMPGISEPTTEGALRKLGRELQRSRSFDNEDSPELTPDDVLDQLVKAVQDRRRGR